MPVTDSDQESVVTLLLRDLHTTVGTAHDHLALEHAARLREFIDDADHYVERVVEDTQQDVHDCFIDTTWPKCPRHQRHPLWIHGGSWWCEKDEVRVAALGELHQLLGAA